MREMFRYADKNGDGSLTLKEVVNLLKHLNIEVDQDQAKQIFDVSVSFSTFLWECLWAEIDVKSVY